MMEWTHMRPPVGLPLEIFDHYGQVREGVCDGGYVRLSDCTHPLQNCIYPRDQVVAWRLRDAAWVRG